MPTTDPRTIMLLSDGTCRTCEQVVKSVLVQFEEGAFRLVKKANIRTAKQAAKVVEEAAREEAAIFFTMVSEKARKAVKDAAQEQMVPTVDVLGPIRAAVNSLAHGAPTSTPGLFYKSEREYFDRVDAIDFTLKHDDGRRLRDLSRADVVLVGVSRTSKSSTCFFLAYRGIRAANVPLFGNHPPPPELLKLDPDKVIGLTANANRLQHVREARLHNLNVEQFEDYVGRQAIIRELRGAQEFMARCGWRTIDASYKAIEEVAREVMQMMEESRKKKRK